MFTGRLDQCLMLILDYDCEIEILVLEALRETEIY